MIVFSLKDVGGLMVIPMMAKEIVVEEPKIKAYLDQLMTNSSKMHSNAKMISTCVYLMKIHQNIR